MITNNTQCAITKKWIRIFTEAIKTHKRIHHTKRDWVWKATLESMESQLKELQDELDAWDPIIASFRGKS